MTLPQKTQDAIDYGRDGITVREGGGMSADGEAAVHLYRLHVIQHSLDFEIKTGVKMSRFSALKAANAALGTNYKRKAQALAHMNELLGVEEE
jgi:hypothetical protein